VLKATGAGFASSVDEAVENVVRFDHGAEPAAAGIAAYAELADRFCERLASYDNIA
jgi:hypothetical protein